jgi:hypothetical protein
MTSEPDGLILPVGPSSRINCEHVSFPAGTVIGYDPAAWDQTLVMVQLGVLPFSCFPLAGVVPPPHDPVLLLLLSPRSTTGQSRSASISPTKSETGRRLNE